MDRLLILLIALAGIGALGLAWRGMKLGLRRSIQVDPETLEHDRPAMLYFSSVDCAPCRLQQAPILDGLRQSLGNSVRFQEYDVVENPQLASRYRVLTVPTTLVIARGGEVVAVNYGLAQADKLRRQLAQAGARWEGLELVRLGRLHSRS